MKYVSLISILFLVSNAQAQTITQLSPPNINLWSVSIADFSHVMIVGDSATVLLSNDSGFLPRYYYHLPPPCDKRHTFYGVSYYDTLHASIVGDNGLIFTTLDEGATWVQSGVGITTQTLRAITHTSRGSLIVVGDSGIILRSTDKGTTWSQVTSNTTHNIHAIAINTNGAGFFVGDHGSIGRTTDYGVSWPFVTDTIRNIYNNSDYINFRAISTDNFFNGIAVATGDAGAIAWERNNRWTALVDTSAPDSASLVAAQRANYRTVSYYGYSTETWDIGGDGDFAVQITVNPSGFTQLWYLSNALGGDADGGIDRYLDRYTCSENWFGQSNPLSVFVSPGESIGTNGEGDIVSPDLLTSYEDFLFLSIDRLGKGFASCSGGYFMKTTDNGATWAWVYPLPDTTAGNNWKVTDIHTFDSNNAFAVGWDGGLFRTTDGGTHWNETTIAAANQERLRGIGHPGGEDYVVCGDLGTIIRSTDNGSTWNASTTPDSNFLEATAFSTPDIGIAAGQNGTIVRTTDRGITWTSVNNPLTGTDYSFRQVQAFPDGTYYATTDSAGLWRSTDQGQNWLQVPNISQTLGEGFFNNRIGVVGESEWSSQTVPDTMRFAFTRDGFATKTEFNIPFVNNDRVCFHFLDSNTFICYGSASFVVKVDMSQSGARVTTVSTVPNSTIRVYPNPTTGEFRIEYATTSSGPVRIQLFSEDGKDMGTLFSGTEPQGSHEQLLTLPQNIAGTAFIRLTSDGTSATTKLTLQ